MHITAQLTDFLRMRGREQEGKHVATVCPGLPARPLREQVVPLLVIAPYSLRWTLLSLVCVAGAVVVLSSSGRASV